MVRQKKLHLFLAALLLLGGVFPSTLQAKIDATKAREFLGSAVSPTGITETDVYSITARVITVALGVVGLAFFVLMFYAGFIWMIDRGNEEAVAKAKKTLTAAIIGIVIVVAAYAVTYFVSQFAVGTQNQDSILRQ